MLRLALQADRDRTIGEGRVQTADEGNGDWPPDREFFRGPTFSSGYRADDIGRRFVVARIQYATQLFIVTQKRIRFIDKHGGAPLLHGTEERRPCDMSR